MKTTRTIKVYIGARRSYPPGDGEVVNPAAGRNRRVGAGNTIKTGRRLKPVAS